MGTLPDRSNHGPGVENVKEEKGKEAGMNAKGDAKSSKCGRTASGKRVAGILERKGYGIGRIPFTGEARDSKACSGPKERQGGAMAQKKATKQQVAKERSATKVQSVLKGKGYKSGKLPEGKELHHVKPVAEGGKTTVKNTRVVTEAKQKSIHKNRKSKGEI